MATSLVKLREPRFVLAVQDLALSRDYYQDKLGFGIDFEGGGWCFLSRGKVVLMLGECPDEKPAAELGNHSYFAYIGMSGIDVFFEEIQANGVELISSLEDKPWGQREFGIRTIDGHRIMFGEAITRD